MQVCEDILMGGTQSGTSVFLAMGGATPTAKKMRTRMPVILKEPTITVLRVPPW